MRRDFSSESRQRVLDAISSVERSQNGNFTNWGGTSRFNISYYIRQVNNYHNKVISKNNETKQKINHAFDEALARDRTISVEMNTYRNSAEQWKHYIERLNSIVSPGKGNFTSQYMFGVLNDFLREIEKGRLDKIRKYAIGEIDGIGEYESILLEELLDKTPYEMSEAELALLLEIMSNSEVWAKVYLCQHFSADVVPASGDTPTLFNNLLKGFEQMMLEQHVNITEDGRWMKDGVVVSEADMIKEMADIVDFIGNNGGGDEASLSASFIKNFAELYQILSGKPESPNDIASGILSLYKSSVSVETSLYKYFLKTLRPEDAERLAGKFGISMMLLKISGNAADLTKEGMETYRVLHDPDSTKYDKAAQIVDFGGKAIDFGGNVYLAGLESTKAIRVVIDGAGKQNQILATQVPKVEYTTSAKISSKLKNGAQWLTLIKSGTATISTGIKRFGEVSEDGEITVTEGASIGIHSSLEGLSVLTSDITAGLIHFDGEKVAVELESEANDFVKSNDWKAQYVRDPNHGIVSRFLVSELTAVEMIGKKTVNIVTDIYKNVVFEGAKILGGNMLEKRPQWLK